MNFYFDQQKRIPSSWNVTRLSRGRKLTDRKIEYYRKRGWYSGEFREARRALMQRKQLRREGNFLSDGGRLIYNPMVR